MAFSARKCLESSIHFVKYALDRFYKEAMYLTIVGIYTTIR